MTRKKSRWTEEEIQELRAFIESGGSPTRGAVRFRRTEIALRTKANELGLAFQSIKERRLRALGVKSTEIATGFAMDVSSEADGGEPS